MPKRCNYQSYEIVKEVAVETTEHATATVVIHAEVPSSFLIQQTGYG
jgi:hypothetical protein